MALDADFNESEILPKLHELLSTQKETKQLLKNLHETTGLWNSQIPQEFSPRYLMLTKTEGSTPSSEERQAMCRHMKRQRGECGTVTRQGYTDLASQTVFYPSQFAKKAFAYKCGDGPDESNAVNCWYQHYSLKMFQAMLNDDDVALLDTAMCRHRLEWKNTYGVDLRPHHEGQYGWYAFEAVSGNLENVGEPIVLFVNISNSVGTRRGEQEARMGACYLMAALQEYQKELHHDLSCYNTLNVLTHKMAWSPYVDAQKSRESMATWMTEANRKGSQTTTLAEMELALGNTRAVHSHPMRAPLASTKTSRRFMDFIAGMSRTQWNIIE